MSKAIPPLDQKLKKAKLTVNEPELEKKNENSISFFLKKKLPQIMIISKSTLKEKLLILLKSQENNGKAVDKKKTDAKN